MKFPKLIMPLVAALLFAVPVLANDPPPAFNVTPGFTVRPEAKPIKPDCGCGVGCTCPPGQCPGGCPVPAADPRQATVCVYGEMGGGRSSRGTGTVIAAEGGYSLILTNEHVITCKDMWVIYWQGGKAYRTPVECIAKSGTSDLALLVLDYELPAAEIADSIPAEGSPVQLYGFGGTDAGNTTDPTRKTGSVANDWIFGWMPTEPTTRHTSHLIQGDSGSGLFDGSGRLIGVNHGIEKQTGIAQAVRIDVVHTFTVNAIKSKRTLFPRFHDRMTAKKIMKAVPALQPKPSAPKQAAPKQANPPLHVPVPFGESPSKAQPPVVRPVPAAIPFAVQPSGKWVTRKKGFFRSEDVWMPSGGGCVGGNCPKR